MYTDDKVLNDKGRIDCHSFRPVLFEFPTCEYFVTGEKPVTAPECISYII